MSKSAKRSAFLTLGQQPISTWGFTVTDGNIVEIDIPSDPVRLRQLDLAVLL